MDSYYNYEESTLILCRLKDVLNFACHACLLFTCEAVLTGLIDVNECIEEFEGIDLYFNISHEVEHT